MSGRVVGQSIRRRGVAYEVPEALIDERTRYEDDERCRRVVEAHPDGMTLEEVSTHFGVTRERIRQIEERALRSLVMRCELAGISREDVISALGSKRSNDTPDTTGGGYVGRGRAGTGSGHWSALPLPVEPYSEHGQRVEAALVELDRITARLEARLVGEMAR